jgi:hypothetical protein
MTCHELWVVYQIASRTVSGKPATAQLVELEHEHSKLVDLEDVLEHVFTQGYVEPKHRSASWWESKEGHKFHGGHSVEACLKEGAGGTPETALRLVVGKITHLRLENKIN